jgi:dTDP-4-dehydrorhamnose reductase
VDDQVGCPTIVSDLAPAALAALRAGATGLLHLTNSGATTWYQLARAAVELAGLEAEQLEPCATEEYPTPARRPAYSVLGSERRDSLGLEDLPMWSDSLPALVSELITWL